MKIVIATAGLGNMMFQYAIVSILRKMGVRSILFVSNANAHHNGYELEHVFPSVKPYEGLPTIGKWYYQFLGKLRKVKFAKNKNFPHQLLLFPFKRFHACSSFTYYSEVYGTPNQNTYLLGYFQCYEYYKAFTLELQKLYAFNESRLSAESSAMARTIRKTEDSVFVHVRRGEYVTDMGLIKRERAKAIRIANGIYREIIPRELTWSTQETMVQQPQWYLRADGSINMEKLLLDFQQFFRENSDAWIGKFDYAEAGPQLLLQAFLQRIVNGGGYIDREYGLGRKRTDLLIRKPLTDGYGGSAQRIVLELRIKRYSLERTIDEGLQQTSAYMDAVGSVDEGHFIIFDRSKEKTWDERIWHKPYEYDGRTIMVWGM